MIVIPAIDIKNGQCVRLKQGDFARKTVFSDDPVAMALAWQEQGAKRLHIVDLDGALSGAAINRELIHEITKKLDIAVQVGGGIRDVETVEDYLSIGVQQVILGTVAVKSPDFLHRITENHPQRIIIGLDAHGAKVATEGWIEDSDKDMLTLATAYSNMKIHSIIYTDIAKDGMLQGPNLDMIRGLLQAVNVPIIASGGVSNIEDIQALKNLQASNLFGVITGRAIYDGRLSLKEAIELTSQ